MIEFLEKYWPNIFTIAISIVSLCISIASYRKAGRFQSYDYSIRLQIQNEDVNLFTPSFQSSFGYKSMLVNRGLKPVEINSVIIEYGAQEDKLKRIRHWILGRFYLSPNESKEITLELSKMDMDSAKEKFETDDCFFFLRVEYSTVSGQTEVAERQLGGYEGDRALFIFQRGDSLS